MAIEVACVMAAGQAGLKSIPYFIDEFIARGIPQLAPRPFDHDNVQIQELDKEFRDTWTNAVLYGMGESRQLATRMDLNDASIPPILKGINPIASQEIGSTMHDSPSRLAAWCRVSLADECRKTLETWDTYKNLHSLGPADQLAVIIPFCPEGPTSGTVGMYLGATMIQCCHDDRRDDVIVWGIELCPPIPRSLTGDPARNVFRGYVAREEMLKGVPLSPNNPEDEDLKPCFHINIAFDGGYSPPPYTDDADVLPALDRAAAQGVACLLTKAGTGDKGESADALRSGTARWNACLVSVVSESSYSPALRCQGYRARLPWHRDPEGWSKRKVGQKKQRFLSSIKTIEEVMDPEAEVRAVRNWFAKLKRKADELGEVGKLDGFFGKKGQLLLEQAVAEDKKDYDDLLKDDPPDEQVMVRRQPFCVSVGFSAEVRKDNAERVVGLTSSDNAKPLSEMLGIASSNQVQSAIMEFCREVLQRKDIDVNAPSRARFQEIRAISIRSPDNRLNDTDFRPTEAALRPYLDSTRALDPPYFQTHDLSGGKGIPKPLLWEPFKIDRTNNARKARTERPIPAEYSFLILARVKEGEGFQDLIAYDGMKSHHDKVVSSPDWGDHNRYYSVRVPDDLVRRSEKAPTGGSHASINGMPTDSGVTRERA